MRRGRLARKYAESTLLLHKAFVSDCHIVQGSKARLAQACQPESLAASGNVRLRVATRRLRRTAFARKRERRLDVMRTTALVILALIANVTGAAQSAREWRDYAGGPDRSRFVAATQITRQNITQLQVAWTPHAGLATDLRRLADAGDLARRRMAGSLDRHRGPRCRDGGGHGHLREVVQVGVTDLSVARSAKILNPQQVLPNLRDSGEEDRPSIGRRAEPGRHVREADFVEDADYA